MSNLVFINPLAAYEAGCAHCGIALPPGEEEDFVLQEDNRYYCSSRCLRLAGIIVSNQYLARAGAGICVECGTAPANPDDKDEICSVCREVRREAGYSDPPQ